MTAVRVRPAEGQDRDADGDSLVARAPVPRAPAIYHAAGLLLAAAGRAAFRVRALGAERLRLEPSTLLVANHPHEADPAVAVAALYPHLHRPWRKSLLVHFTLRDDLYTQGFFAGYPLNMPLRARRAVYPLGLRRVFDGPLPCPVLRSADRMLAVDLLRWNPDAELEVLLPDDLAARFRLRALELGKPPPRAASDVLNGAYADLLWWVVHSDAAAGEQMERAFADRATAARHDFRRFVDIVRSGGVVLISPEGRSSPDGALQQLKPGAGALVRLAHPRAVVPLGIAYDTLVRGRPWAYVAVGAAVQPPRRGVDEALRNLLARTVPLVVGQVVADALLRRERDGLADRLAREVEAAEASGRPFDPLLKAPAERAARIRVALDAAERHPERLPRLAACYRSVRG